MTVEIVSPPPIAHAETVSRARPAESLYDATRLGRSTSDASDASGVAGVVPVLAQDLALWKTLCAPPAADHADSTETFAAAGSASATDQPPTALEQLNIELTALIEATAQGDLDTCSFDLDLPGLGQLQGRLSLRRDRADMELRGLTPGMAAVLRSRRQELQQGLDQAVSGHDVNLFIA